MATLKRIRAVAISNTPKSSVISDATPASLSGVRPYIKGLIQRLDILGYEIGTSKHYVIDYRECTESQLPQNLGGAPAPDCVLCLSKTVLDAAANPANVPNTTPKIAIVSNPPSGNPVNICGISGERHQIAKRYYERFLQTVPGLQRVGILHKDNYPPSVTSLTNIGLGPVPTPFFQVTVPSPYTDALITNAINAIALQPGQLTGLIILPADSFFGAAQSIIAAARGRGIPDFWSITDWVKHDLPSALGGFGVPQVRCGELLADKIAHIWSTGNMPNPRFTRVDTNSDVVWLVSEAAAAQLGNLPLGTATDLRHV